MPPLLILALGMLTVIGMIVVLRANAFFALITAAVLVSVLAPGDWADKIGRVATAFGSTAGGIGIVIALAAVIGMCMQESRAADRVVRSFLGIFGVERSAAALMASGFVLSIPVFFDTVFYLLIPLARSMYRRTGKNYALYVMAIGAGAVATHSLVPPTPGPLANAANLGVDLGTMILVGIAVGLPGSIAALIVARRIDAKLNIPLRTAELSAGDTADESHTADPEVTTTNSAAGNNTLENSVVPEDQLPGLAISLLPILLPVALIASNTMLQAVDPDAPLTELTAVIGNPNFAMLVSTAIALWLYLGQRRPSKEQITRRVESSLMSGGLIILITAAGGAFGAMLQAAQIGPAIQQMFGGSNASGLTLLILGFLVASLLKFAQGSSTVAMITTSAMLGSMITPGSLGFNPVYVATAIGCGAMVGSWMNDSGFWIISKMGGLTEVETFKTWTAMAAITGIVGMLTTVLLALVLPLV